MTGGTASLFNWERDTLVVDAPRQQGTPPAPVAYDPMQDMQLRAAVVNDYNQDLRSTERKARGMAFDRSRQFRKKAQEESVQSVATKYQLTDDQVRRLLGW
jgi:hypothetical protein